VPTAKARAALPAASYAAAKGDVVSWRHEKTPAPPLVVAPAKQRRADSLAAGICWSDVGADAARLAATHGQAVGCYIRGPMKQLLLAGLLLSALGVRAQATNPPAQDTSRKNAFVRRVKAQGLLRDPAWYYRCKIDVTKAKALYKEGVDLAVLDKRVGPGTYRENLLYAATVVRGSVSRQRYDERKEVYYHSMYDIKVDEVLAGQVKTSVLTVCLRSGKLGDVTLRSLDEPKLSVGEQVILYLNPVDLAELAEAKAQGLWNYEDNAQASDFNLVEKYSVKEGYVFNAEGRIDRTGTVNTNIRRISALLDKANFSQKSFD